MDPVYVQGYEPANRRYRSHFDLLQHHRQLIVLTYFGSMAFWIVATFITMAIQTCLMERGRKDPASSWNEIYNKSRSTQWLHASYAMSIVHAVILMFLCVVATLKCDPPELFKIKNGGFLANTCFQNDWCVDNGNKWELITVCFFAGYLTVDFYNCAVLIGDFSSGSIQNFVHHLIGLLGTASSLVTGRMILTLSNITCLTELSTPFVSMRAILHMHKKSTSTIYIINGLMMTGSFGLCRCLFQTWLVTRRLIPAFLDRS